MRKRVWPVLLLLVCSFLQGRGAVAASGPCTRMHGATDDDILQCMEGVLGSTGATWAIETVPGSPVLGSVGDLGPSSIVNMASVSKPVLAAGVLKLIEEYPAKFPAGIDTPVHAITTPAGNSFMDAFKGDPQKEQITVRHLLTHTSGMAWFENWPSCDCADCTQCAGCSEDACLFLRNARAYLRSRPVALPASCSQASRAWLGSPGLTDECAYDEDLRTWTTGRATGVWKLSRFVMGYPLRRAPGESGYSNYGYLVLARLIEGMTGMSFNVYLQEKILRPLGMRDSFYVPWAAVADPAHPFHVLVHNPLAPDHSRDEKVSAEQRARIADVHLIAENGQRPVEVAPPLQADTRPDKTWDEERKGWKNPWPEGGLFSTMGDMLKFLRMVKNDGQGVLRADLARFLKTDLVPGPVSHAAGFGLSARHDAESQGGKAEGSIAHLGRFMTYIWYDPRGLIGVFSSQRLTRQVEKWDEVAMGKRPINAFIDLASQRLEPVATSGLILGFDALRAAHTASHDPLHTFKDPVDGIWKKQFDVPLLFAEDGTASLNGSCAWTDLVSGTLQASFQGFEQCGWTGLATRQSPLRMRFNYPDVPGTADVLQVLDSRTPAAYTIELWVHAVGLSANRNVVARTTTSGATTTALRQIRHRPDGSGQVFFEHQVELASGGSLVVSAATPAGPGWHHVVATGTSGVDLRLYVDGRLEGAQTRSVGLFRTGGDRYRIGEPARDGFFRFVGAIARFAVYNREISATEVADNC
ncbi:MAG TPA: serine hydrolase, partial [Thermoanaerobaculia bacterium]|nr:serine hydrolase [Thermoanaerobaculia bacterium]